MPQANSFVDDLVVQADHVLDHVHLHLAKPSGTAGSRADQQKPAAVELSIQQLSTAKSSKSALHDTQLIRSSLPARGSPAQTQDEQSLRWVLIGKATSQTYGVLLDTLLRQILPLNDEINYWSDVLDSVRYTAFYSLQTAPLRLWSWSRSVYHEVRTNENLAQDSWNDFYSIVRSVVRTRSLADATASFALPTAVIRDEIQAKIDRLQRAKSAYAASIGLLLSHGFDTSKGLQSLKMSSQASVLDQPWRNKIADAVHIMDAVFGIRTQDEDWRASLEAASSTSLTTSSSADLDLAHLQGRLAHILDVSLPAHVSTSSHILASSGRPSPLIRYWLPAAALLLSSSTLLRILVSRRAALATWVADAGTTALAFWHNWVVEPARSLLATIRHDAAAEVSLMSRASLAGDTASLERMVVDFAVDNPADGVPLTPAAVAAVRTAVRAGDLTPVLRAYEADLKAPLARSLRGNLIRALLIQVQKTKVDVELAMRGIDSLLQSQQLVFGLASLTPGLLVVVGAARYAAALLSSRSGRAVGEERARAAALLRNIDRVLARPAPGGTLPSEPFGLLVVEAVLLRETAARAMPRAVFREFRGDFDALIDAKGGVARQVRAADRIRWGYARWL